MNAQTKQQSKWTIKRLLEWTTQHFTQAQVSQPRLSAEILLAYVLGCERIDLYVKFDNCPDAEQLTRFRELVKRAAQHEPCQYLTGKAHFYSLELEVTPAVLIPRPETELLVTGAIDFCRRETHRPTIDVLDLCTGSACVAIAIAANVIETDIIATDRSKEALDIAGKNIAKHDLQERIALYESDLFDKLNQAPKSIFDLLVSNPPYVSNAEFEQLAPMIRNYEPKHALLAGDDGLDVIRQILDQAEPYLADEGALMLEIGYNQAQDTLALFEKCGYLKDITAVKDNLGHQRIVKARKKDG